MNCYFDTSALIKRYIEESGSIAVSEIFREAESVLISEISKVECVSVLKRINVEGQISDEEYEYLKKEIQADAEDFTLIKIVDIIDSCEEAIDKYQLKTLDAIQLASAIYAKDEIDNFVCCDNKLNAAASSESIQVINPDKIK